MSDQVKGDSNKSSSSDGNSKKSKTKGNGKKQKLATDLAGTFSEIKKQRQKNSGNNQLSKDSMLQHNHTNSRSQPQLHSAKQKINYVEYTPKTLRRVQKQGKYSSLQTLSMDLLRKESLYQQSKEFAQKIGVNRHKNYFITALRLSLLFHHKVFKQNQTIQKVIDEIFEYFQNFIKSCVEKKYQNNKNLINATLLKSKSDINVFKKVFQSDLSDYNTVFDLVKGLYDCKSDGKYSQTHKKNADKLARIIMGVAKDGMGYSQNFDPFKKLIPDIFSCILSMGKKKSQQSSQSPVYQAKLETIEDQNQMQQQQMGIGVELNGLINQQSARFLDFDQFNNQLNNQDQMGQDIFPNEQIENQFQQHIHRLNQATNSYVCVMCNMIQMKSPLLK